MCVVGLIEKEHLLPIAQGYRKALELHWRQSHHSWGDMPDILSENMCRYSCLYAQKQFLTEHQISTTIVIGRPARDDQGTPRGCYGFLDQHKCYHDHAWLTTGNWIIDLTADQFKDAPVIIAPIGDTRYCSNPEQELFLDKIQALQSRVNGWLSK